MNKEAKGYAVVTGATSGIGLHMAKELAVKGYPLLLVGRRKDRLKRYAAIFSKGFTMGRKKVAGVPCQVVEADLSTKEGCERLIKAMDALPVIDILINNAGFGECGRFSETDTAKELALIDVNVRALHELTKYGVCRMEKEGHGRILNVGSSAGLLPAGPYMAAYYASKAYVVSLSRAVACELAEEDSKVTVSCLCPGPVDTEFNQVANVEFSLPGIRPEVCAHKAVKGLLAGKEIIVPGFYMKLLCSMGRCLPAGFLVKMIGRQQKRKLFG